MWTAFSITEAAAASLAAGEARSGPTGDPRLPAPGPPGRVMPSGSRITWMSNEPESGHWQLGVDMAEGTHAAGQRGWLPMARRIPVAGVARTPRSLTDAELARLLFSDRPVAPIPAWTPPHGSRPAATPIPPASR